MNSWRRYIPALSLALGLSAFVSAALHLQRGDGSGKRPSLVGAEPAAPITVRPTISDPSVGRARAPRPRPLGLLELTITAPEKILMTEQRAALLKHLSRIKLVMNVPDAMSFASHEKAGLFVLSAASSKDAGFFLFSERKGRRLAAGGARKFLREYFGDVVPLTAAAADEKFLSRGAGEMAWIKGTGAGGQRFDAFAVTMAKTGFNHLLFILDPTVANASRRLMVDSIRAAK